MPELIKLAIQLLATEIAKSLAKEIKEIFGEKKVAEEPPAEKTEGA